RVRRRAAHVEPLGLRASAGNVLLQADHEERALLAAQRAREVGGDGGADEAQAQDDDDLLSVRTRACSAQCNLFGLHAVPRPNRSRKPVLILYQPTLNPSHTVTPGTANGTVIGTSMMRQRLCKARKSSSLSIS